MKRAIEVREIRKGDLIRWEGEHGNTIAHEYRATAAGHKWSPADGTYFLLDRPTPPVELPKTPQLGWLGVTDDGTFERKPASVLGIWQDRRYSINGGVSGTWSHEFVTAFEPATAVPTEALDDLRRYRASLARSGLTRTPRHIDAFLAAIEAAGSGA